MEYAKMYQEEPGQAAFIFIVEWLVVYFKAGGIIIFNSEQINKIKKPMIILCNQ